MSIMSIEEVASKSQKSQKTVRRAIASGKLIASKVHNKYRIKTEDYSNWLHSSKISKNKTLPQSNNEKREKTIDDINWFDISNEWKVDGWKTKSDLNGLKFIDLFSGAGGLSCGLVMAGFTPVASVEIMEQAVETYDYNFNYKKKFKESIELRDIRDELVKKELVEKVENEDIDLIVGGFPCQGFSMAGYRVVADPRNNLYLEMLDIVQRIKPKFIVMENVEGLRSMLNGKVEEKIIEDFKKIGYDINVTILNAADYYVPQQRNRIIFVGNRIRAKNYHPKPLLNKSQYVTLGQAIKKYLKKPENKSINHEFTRHSQEMAKKLSEVEEGKSLYKNYSDAWKKSPWDKPSCTIKENHGGVNIHPKLPRVLTPRELATLQSFPSDFIFKGSKKWQLVQIGNAVPPLLGKAIGLAVKKALDEIEKDDGN